MFGSRIFDEYSELYDLVRRGLDEDLLLKGLRHSNLEIKRILDIGGGTGRSIDGLDIEERYIIDASRGMLKRASMKGFRCIEADAHNLPIKKNTMDAVIIVDAIHHIDNPLKVFSEVENILRSGGVLVIYDIDPDTLRGGIVELFEDIVGFESCFYGPGEIEELMNRAGIISYTAIDGFQYLTVGKKK